MLCAITFWLLAGSARAVNIYGVGLAYTNLQSNTDPFEGANISANSPVNPDNPYPENLFGGTGGTEGDTVVFADGEPVGSVDFIRFNTAAPIELSSYRLFLAGGYPGNLEPGAKRCITQFTLWYSPDATYDTLSLVSLANVSAPYAAAYGSTIIAVEDSFQEVVGQYFEVEVVRASTYGPRLIELDANVVPEPSIASFLIIAGLLIGYRKFRHATY